MQRNTFYEFCKSCKEANPPFIMKNKNLINGKTLPRDDSILEKFDGSMWFLLRF